MSDNKIQELYFTHEKEYKKITRKWIIMLVIISTLLVTTILYSIFHYKFYILPLMSFYIWPLHTFIKRWRNQKYMNNDLQFQKVLTDDFDFQSILEIRKRLLQNTKRLDYMISLISYLCLLFNTCNFNEFESVYDTNRNILKHAPSILKLLKKGFVELMQDKTIYRDKIFQHRFSRYHYAKGPLPQRGEMLRAYDIACEIRKLYENQKYQEVINRIEELDYTNFSWKMLKERATYHLAPDDYHMPEIENPELLASRQLTYLVETKSEYYYENADEIYFKLEKDYVKAKKHLKIKKALYFSVALIIFFLSNAVVDKIYDNNANIKYASYFDVKPNNVYLFCENEEISGAIISCQSSDNNNYNYYIAGTIGRMIRHSYSTGKQLDKTVAYTHTGKHSTYVALIVNKDTQIYYDGELQATISEEIPGLLEDEIAKAFIIDGKFELSKLSYK